METPKMVVFVVKLYAVREAKEWRYAVRNAKIERYAVRKGGGGVTLITINYISDTKWIVLTPRDAYTYNVCWFVTEADVKVAIQLTAAWKHH